MAEVLTKEGNWETRIREILDTVCRPEGSISLSGLVARGAKALFLASVLKEVRQPVVYLCVEEEPQRLLEEWRFYSRLIGGTASGASSGIEMLPSIDVDPYRGTSPHPEVLAERAETLFRLAGGRIRALVLPLRSALTRVPTPAEVLALGKALKVNTEASFEHLERWLMDIGYVRRDPVTSVGEFSSRGGLLDVFSPAHDAPRRIEFFGDTIESIRAFDPDSQRSVTTCDEAAVLPLREFSSSPDDFELWTIWARERFTDPVFTRDLQEKVEFAENGEAFPGWEFMLPAIQPPAGHIGHYFHSPLWVLDEPGELIREALMIRRRASGKYSELMEVGQIALPPESYYLNDEELAGFLECGSRIELEALGREAGLADLTSSAVEGAQLGRDFEAAQDRQGRAEELLGSPLVRTLAARSVPEVEIVSRSVRRFRGHLKEFSEELNRYREQDFSILIGAHARGMAERLGEMLKEYELPVRPLGQELVDGGFLSPDGSISISVGKMGSGFELPSARFVAFSETDIFEGDDWENRLPAPKKAAKSSLSAFLSDFRDLKPGDYVVHVDHGIGKFAGLMQLGTDQEDPREFLLLLFAEDARLYVPVERLDLVQKYSGAEGASPSLDRLGGVGWQKTKAKARKALRDMADELLKLYAARSVAAGFAFGQDTSWQAEFEEAFEFELTTDQESAIVDIKRDMEKPVPMDRLLCGDVGYGKTEVAMRAAFKALMDGKQVVVLVPTTVLAYQHFRTFEQRFAAFPAKIELLSRFRTPKEQKRVLEDTAEGGVDILIGTHRLFSRDLRFRDLGLIVVDEEQRFGVAHKERLKQLRRKVDVLTLSATPIPRTLNMSLMGLKPMSVIETPPRDRLAIQTTVAQFSHGLMLNAIERELDRGGQVFFIHNRIDSIYTIAELLRRLVPRARLSVTHAQMGARELESVMLQFVRHELDVLVSTTIIENGIDIPLANTIIINHADRLGLSELYQLRGRVGRSNRRAYAYLLIPHESTITPVARRRLAAIREFSDLGAGFRLAALDLELRGAGNLLGAEQSGMINSVGFELYCQMLESAVRELRGEVVEEEAPTQIDLKVDIRIPEAYIPDMGQRIRLYKRVSSARDEERIVEIRSELADRYGALPPAVDHLLAYARLRCEAIRARVFEITRAGDTIYLKFDPAAPMDGTKMVGLIQGHSGVSFSPGGVLRYPPEQLEPQGLMDELRNLLLRLRTAA
ncbi:MAG: transcription-repair coupling factor [Acidobacteria bacterium]|nr:transcription-repair coupling factor [Acidobacteriota bacterium]